MTSARSHNTSRAFWDLKAEQVMDRVFRNAAATYRQEQEAEAAAAEPLIELVEVREEPPTLVVVPDGASSTSPGNAAAPRRAGRQRPIPEARRRSQPQRPQADPTAPATASQAPAPPTPLWVVAGLPIHPRLATTLLASMAVMAAGISLVLWRGWSQASFDLQQERTVRLLENLRGSTWAGPQAGSAAATAKGKAATSDADGLPPPPPNEPWVEELSSLPSGGGGGGNGAAVLRVPVNGPLNQPAPAASRPSSTAGGGPASPPPPVPASPGAIPELMGVVQIPGRSGSAIFQVGSSSSNALVGEQIGSSGWRLVSTGNDSAVIEKGGVSRRISISSGF